MEKRKFIRVLQCSAIVDATIMFLSGYVAFFLSDTPTNNPIALFLFWWGVVAALIFFAFYVDTRKLSRAKKWIIVMGAILIVFILTFLYSFLSSSMYLL